MAVEGIAIPRVMLHAKVLGFVHPVSNQRVTFSADLPEDMMTVLDALKGKEDVSSS